MPELRCRRVHFMSVQISSILNLGVSACPPRCKCTLGEKVNGLDGDASQLLKDGQKEGLIFCLTALSYSTWVISSDVNKLTQRSRTGPASWCLLVTVVSIFSPYLTLSCYLLQGREKPGVVSCDLGQGSSNPSKFLKSTPVITKFPPTLQII